jgi:hypothetical protein
VLQPAELRELLRTRVREMAATYGLLPRDPGTSVDGRSSALVKDKRAGRGVHARS